MDTLNRRYIYQDITILTKKKSQKIEYRNRLRKSLKKADSSSGSDNKALILTID